MTGTFEELDQIANSLEEFAERGRHQDLQGPLKDLWDAAEQVGRCSSGSWIGYHANVYYQDLRPPPPGVHFSSEWGPTGVFVPERTIGNWVEYDPSKVTRVIYEHAQNPDVGPANTYTEKGARAFQAQKHSILSNMEIITGNTESTTFSQLREEIEQLSLPTQAELTQSIKPARGMTRDSRAAYQGIWIPPHIRPMSLVLTVRTTIERIEKLAELTRQVISHGSRLQRRQQQEARVGNMIFIGHGHSPVWRELKDFLQDRLELSVDEYTRVSNAGRTTQYRLSEMMDIATLAFLLMTGEDETAEGELRARENVVHEVGLFQGRLGFERAIVLLEDGCEEFSNIIGIEQIRFDKGRIDSAFEKIRMFLERENIINAR